MKKYIITIVCVALTIACSDYLDVNKDPDTIGASQIKDPKFILPIAEVNLANTLMGWDFGINAGFYSQYWTAAYDHAQFKAVSEYQPVSMSTAYTNLTAGVLTDLKKIKRLSPTTEDKKYNGYSYMSEALSIYTWQILTDVWGDIPYTEAIKGDAGTYHPKFDKGRDIYIDLIKRIDELVKVDPKDFTISSNKSDFIFGGDFSKWKLFVNSLKLKLMMRVSETDLYDNAALVSYINSTQFLEESAKVSGQIWQDNQEGKRHPMREYEQGGANYLSNAVIACKTFVDYMLSKNDKRIESIFTSVNGNYKGAFFGDFDSKTDSDSNGTNDDKEKYSKPSFAADQDIVILSNWEVSFFLAEVNARASNEALAKTYYERGIKQSFEQHKITDAPPTELNWVSGRTVEQNIEQIAMQRWVADANYQHIEAFLERNRTRYPALDKVDVKADRVSVNRNFPVGKFTLSVAGRALTNDVLPQSATYPEALLYRNNKALSQKENATVKVWWNKKTQD